MIVEIIRLNKKCKCVCYFYGKVKEERITVREIYQPYPSQSCDVDQHYQIRARATKEGNEHVRAE